MEIPIETATVIVAKNSSLDKVTLEINLPDPMGYAQHHKMYLHFDAKKDNGAEYVARNFPNIPISVVNI